MNRRPTGSLSLAKAITGFLQYKAAEGLSPNTLQSYQRDLKLWLEYARDIPLQQITTALLQEYFVWLRTDYQPRRITRNREALSSKPIHNFYISLCAFFTWAKRELDLPNPIKAIPAPKFEQAPIEPSTKEEVEALLKACEQCNEAKTTDRRKYIMRRATGRRAQAALQKRGLPLATNQVRYSLLDRKIEVDGTLDAARELGVTITAYTPLASGLLTGKYHKNPALLKNKSSFWRSRIQRQLEASHPLVVAQEEITLKYEATAAQVALNWLIWFNEELVVTIPGATKTQQAAENAGAMRFRLSDAELARLDELSRSFR